MLDWFELKAIRARSGLMVGFCLCRHYSDGTPLLVIILTLSHQNRTFLVWRKRDMLMKSSYENVWLTVIILVNFNHPSSNISQILVFDEIGTKLSDYLCTAETTGFTLCLLHLGDLQIYHSIDIYFKSTWERMLYMHANYFFKFTWYLHCGKPTWAVWVWLCRRGLNYLRSW